MDGKGPLCSYFKGENLHAGGANNAGLFGIIIIELAVECDAHT